VSVNEVDHAFTAFVETSYSRSLRLAVLLTGNLAAGQDLLQVVCEQLYKRWRRHGSPDSPDAYMRTALVNAASKSRRHRTTRMETLVDELSDEQAYEIGPEVLLRRHLMPALRRLSPRQRSVIVLRYFLDLTESDTAELLSCSVGTVKTQASRALRHLREDPSLADQLAAMEV
jgi:RNA polymerase sigma-70 factor (sigma-E family)